MTGKRRVPTALSIAGSDPSGGAGIQADLKTFTALGVYGAAVITALTAQNTTGVQGVHPVPPDFVAHQIGSVLDDLAIGAIKTGMLADAQITSAVVESFAGRELPPVVVDPVMVATSGDPLLAPDAVATIKQRLFPLAALVTPNLHEAAHLLSSGLAASEAEMIDQAAAIAELGPGAVLVKGGHSEGDAVDVLFVAGKVTKLRRPRVATRNTHGTGCTLSSAIAAFIARGLPLAAAVEQAKVFVWEALAAGADIDVGHGSGPVDHLYRLRDTGA